MPIRKQAEIQKDDQAKQKENQENLGNQYE